MCQGYTNAELISALQRCENEHGKVTQKILDQPGNDYPYSSTYSNHFGTLTKAKTRAGVKVSQVHLTDEEYEAIDRDLRNDTELQELLKGLLLGDAFMQRDEGKNAKFSMEMINEEFLNWVADQMGDACSYVKLKATAAELYEKNSKHYDNVSLDRYNDIYMLRSRSVPFFNRYYEWYDSGEKRYPDDIELSPSLVRMWYCCDGSLNHGNDTPYAVVYCSNEHDRPEYLKDRFKDQGLSPSVHAGGGGTIQFTRVETPDFFEWIGSPPPGFEYKWPEYAI